MKIKSIKTASQLKSLLKENSPFWLQQIEAHPEDIPWILEDHSLKSGRTVAAIRSVWRDIPWKKLSSSQTFSTLRKIKRQEMLRITIRDLMDIAHLDETVAELSALADFCLQMSLQSILKEVSAIHGTPQSGFAIFGLGKHGGQELNYSSDIDIIFVYSEEGELDKITYHDFFKKVAEKVMQGFQATDHEGSLFRVDLRLRPEGNGGPITRSLESYENYYAAFGEVWERMALQKARFVAGDPELGYEFVQHLQPFCFPKHLPPSALDEIFQIKARIEAEILKEGGLERHLKLGRGGIREIEFSVQALQLIHGAHHAFSQESGTLKSLQALQRIDLLNPKDAAALTRAYVFLRRLEHRLQMRENQQTHTVPEDRATQISLSKNLGYKSHAKFEAEWKSHIEFVRNFFHGIVRPSGMEKNGFQPSHPCLMIADEASLKQMGFKDPEKATSVFQTLANGPEYAHVSQRTRNLFQQLQPHILLLVPKLAQPDHVLQQFERFIETYGSRAALYELLASNPKMMELLFKLFDQSFYLTEILIHQPTLLDSIAFEGFLAVSRNREDMKAILEKEPAENPESRLRLFRSAEWLRIELRDILGIAQSPEETWDEFSRLADICLAEAVRISSQPTGKTSKKGPQKKNEAEGFAIIALGKYGGRELSYGSDLDVIFIGGSAERAARVISIMSQERKEGIVFKVDARLRPDGEDGVLTLPLEGYVSYYKKRAQFWEKQALTRARVAAGDFKLGEKFLGLVDQTIYARPISLQELKEMADMEERIENERGDPSDPIRDFKTGSGGIVEVEFFAQKQQLLYGCKHIELRRASTSEVLRIASKIKNWKAADTKSLMDDYLWLRKLESVVRRFRNLSISQLPESREDWDIFARRLDLENTQALQKELLSRRSRIHKTIHSLDKA